MELFNEIKIEEKWKEDANTIANKPILV